MALVVVVEKEAVAAERAAAAEEAAEEAAVTYEEATAEAADTTHRFIIRTTTKIWKIKYIAIDDFLVSAASTSKSPSIPRHMVNRGHAGPILLCSVLLNSKSALSASLIRKKNDDATRNLAELAIEQFNEDRGTINDHNDHFSTTNTKNQKTDNSVLK